MNPSCSSVMPRDAAVRDEIADYVGHALDERARLRGLLNRVTNALGTLT
jgi:hypothetical protein